MKKRDRIIKKGNVILFPDLEKRLLENGLEQLKEKNYRKAIDFLSEAKKLNPDNEDTCIGLVLAYFESGNFAVAKQLTKEMLYTDIGEYLKIFDMYIMILVELNQYEEIVTNLEVLFEEKEVPKEKFEHFSKILQFSKKMIQDRQNQADEPFQEPNELDQQQSLNLVSITDPGEQIQMAGKLSDSNIRSFIDEIAEYLRLDQGDPFFKTLLLNVLKDHDYSKEIVVTKFGKSQVVTPNLLFELHSHPDFLEITAKLSDVLEQENPNLLAGIINVMERHFLLLYPFSTEFNAPKVWAGAFHFVTLAYFGQEEELEEIANMYNIDKTVLSSAIAVIEGFEEISSP
jgi:tetratricopeptide (TPR) repeat protein